jgi:hypothetical protein
MTSKLDLKAISEYSNTFSQKISNDFFENKSTISGSEILNLCIVDQVNMFTIKSLFENWKTTTEKFKSPYFDFENEKVKDALQNLMNIVSQNIAVKKEDLQPLVAKACAETLALTLNPHEYFEGILRDLPDFRCTKADVMTLKKYNRINSHILEAFLSKFENNDSIFINQALDWHNEIIEGAQFDDKELIISQFKSILPCETVQFYKNKNREENPVLKPIEGSFFDSISSSETSPTSKIEEIIIPKAEEKIIEIPAEEKPQPINLNEQYQSAEPTINDQLKPNEGKSLVDLHQNTPIKNLAASISLNQKFVFINKLFNGDSAAYNETMQILENCRDTEEAVNLLKYKYSPKYQWNLNSDEADELIDILKRKV